MARMQSRDGGPPEQPGLLTVVTTATDGIRVVSLTGEIDHNTAHQMLQALDITGTRRPRIVADLHQVTFMDSSALNALIAAHQAVTEAGGWLRLAAPTAPVQRVLQLVGVDQLIDCHPTLRQALTP
ncbi:STAS domain-containing protein [Streptomyces sp. HO565]|uniref:STAS domain-containing protein n=1 Tax=Streptomyces sp. HO565 TaxID=2857489 RepID=UPI0038B4744B